MSFGFKSKPNPETCSHSETVTVTTAGLERVICERCAHVSVRFVDDHDLEGELDRTAFAREADTERAAVPAGSRARRRRRFAFLGSHEQTEDDDE